MGIRRLIVVIAICFVFPLPKAIAQEARSFEQLQVLIKPGDTIHVTDSMGVTSKGKVTGLSDSILRLSAKGSTRDLSEADVYKIQQWRGDSLKNGALIGFGVGVGMGVVSSFFCEGSEGASCKVGTITISAGVYTLIGIGIDALIPTNKTIYFGGTRTTSNTITIRPILQSSRKGATLAYSF